MTASTPSLTEKHFGFVPGQSVGVRMEGIDLGEPDLTPFQLVVHPTVGVVVTKLAARGQPHVRSDRHVPEIEEPVQVTSERNAVRDRMRFANRAGSDVRGIDHRQRMLCGHGALLPVGIEHCESEA